MKILVIGGGGREHAICAQLRKSKKVSKLFCLPGNAGISQIAECIAGSVLDFDFVVSVAKEKNIDLVFVAPDDPLALGLVDRLNLEGIRAFGPNKAAAIIEGSKAFAKDFMSRNNIPTAQYQTFSDIKEAQQYVSSANYPLVIKADGLAFGKGVIICATLDEAMSALYSIMQEKQFGKSGDLVVVEEFLCGDEFTLLAFSDGVCVKCMPTSHDYKKAYDDDLGLNTGGMGAFAPSPIFTKELEDETMQKIVYPTISALKKENREFKGVIYFGLIATKSGVFVIEYNARFGDPETQVTLPLLKTDFVDILNSCIDGTLHKLEIEWFDKTALTVVVAQENYPTSTTKGLDVKIDRLSDDIILFHSGTALKGDNIVANGGRVFCVGALDDSIEKARETVYKEIKKIQFEGARFRSDIGLKKWKR